ncbi:MAG: SDR family oxidoreductase [Rhodococcus sp. (in: high G+C Gram-positive bacteria)]|jgi:3alpha(or 20beta)-hydroxysteroid dehydrogenase|uniref:SDR family oxidoreductase n=1 Tax=Rhodococcoides yunnanense TaxID=278209 RepID=UPI00096838CB|nr:SDR family oxidoreductase [Rhodococcus yunnanensis]MCZ4278725.1 SDR family oxidoreductase [Rhodococcus yunnanensis]OLT33281.1 3-alpha-hydroxysteroid dehydrogenase [Rhodococcus sp. CUA-806]
MNVFEGRSAVVTGGARGIGAAVVRALAESGVRVMVGDVLDEEGERLAESLGDAVRYRHLDVTEKADWEVLLEEAETMFGPLAILVNNAGILALGGIDEQSPESFRHILDVNLYGPWLGMHVAAPLLRRAGGGVIVNVSSTAGLMGYSSLGGYVASKWGLRGLTKAAALDLSTAGVRVCSVHPGPIRTPMTAGFGDETAANQPIPRFGEPEEVAAMVRFIVFEATYSTGSEFVVDGGATTGMVLATPAESD